MSKSKKITLNKKSSKFFVEFIPDKDDDWFWTIKEKYTKSKKEQASYIIIKKDLDDWMNSYTRKGFKQE